MVTINWKNDAICPIEGFINIKNTIRKLLGKDDTALEKKTKFCSDFLAS